MNIKQIAIEVAEQYIDEHPDCNEQLIFQIVNKAVTQFDSTKHSNPTTFFNIQIRNTLYRMGEYKSSPKPTQSNNDKSVPAQTITKAAEFVKAIKQDEIDKPVVTVEPAEVAEPVEPVKSIATIEPKKPITRKHKENIVKMSTETRDAIIADLLAGMNQKEIVEKYNVNASTTRNNIRNWKKYGLLPADFIPTPSPRAPRNSLNKDRGTSETTHKPVSCTSIEETIHKDSVMSILPESNERSKCIKPEEKTIDFITAANDITKFIANITRDATLVAVSADNETKYLRCKYKTEAGEVVTIKICTEPEGS